jgi:hypothetical protein
MKQTNSVSIRRRHADASCGTANIALEKRRGFFHSSGILVVIAVISHHRSPSGGKVRDRVRASGDRKVPDSRMEPSWPGAGVPASQHLRRI